MSQLPLIDQYIADRYLFITDKEIATQLGLTEHQIEFRRIALNLKKSKGWQPRGYNKEMTLGYRDRDYEEITPEITIDQQIYALEMFAQDRPEGSVLAMIARNTIEHLQKIKQRL